MSIKVTFEFDTAAEASVFMNQVSGQTQAAAPAKAEAPAKPPKKQKAEAPAETPAVQEKAAPEPAAPELTTAANEVDYPTLQKAVFTLAGKSRDAAASVAASFGVKTFKELPAEQWAGALEAVNAKLAELEA